MNQENESPVMNQVKDPKPLILTTIVCIAVVISTTFMWHLGGVTGNIFSLAAWSDTPVLLLWSVIAIPTVMLVTFGKIISYC